MLKANLKEIRNLINNQNFLVDNPEKGEPVTPCMDVYKAKTRSGGSFDNLKLIIVIRGDLHNKDLIWGTWSPTSSMRTFKSFLADAFSHNTRVYKLVFIGALLQAKSKMMVFVKLDSIYPDYFPEYSS